MNSAQKVTQKQYYVKNCPSAPCAQPQLSLRAQATLRPCVRGRVVTSPTPCRRPWPSRVAGQAAVSQRIGCCVAARELASLRRVARHSPAGQAPYVTIQPVALQYISLPALQPQSRYKLCIVTRPSAQPTSPPSQCSLLYCDTILNNLFPCNTNQAIQGAVVTIQCLYRDTACLLAKPPKLQYNDYCYNTISTSH